MSNASSISFQQAQFHYSVEGNGPYHNFTVDMIGNLTLQSNHDEYFTQILYGVVVPFLFGMVTLIGVIGNSLVIYVISTKQRMRTLTNLLLLNLAVADLSFVIICPPFTAYVFATSRWPVPGLLGNAVCKIMHYLLNVTAYVTIYTLLLIAVIRYMTIVHNAATVRYRTKRMTGFLIMGIWLLMLAVNLPILWIYGVQENHFGEPDCENYGYDIGKRLYATFFVFGYLLPLTVIAVLSVRILVHINNRHRPRSSSSDNPFVRSSTEGSRTEVHKRQASRLLIAVVVIFAIFWLPIHIHLLNAYYGQIPDNNVYHVVSVLFHFLAYFNSCVNPIIYNCASKDFRESFRDAMCCGFAPRQCTGRRDTQTVVQAQESAFLMPYHNNQGTSNNNFAANGSTKHETRLTVGSPDNSPPSVRSVAL